MARSREIPYDLDWLRSRLRRRDIGVDLPLGVSEDDARAICEAIPSDKWAAIANSWRQREHRRGSKFAINMNMAMQDMKRLGTVWESLIRMGCVTREDAELLAREVGNRFGGSYCDPFARQLVKDALHQLVDQVKGRNPNQHAINIDLARKGSDVFGITDPVELSLKSGIPLEACIEGLK